MSSVFIYCIFLLNQSRTFVSNFNIRRYIWVTQKAIPASRQWPDGGRDGKGHKGSAGAAPAPRSPRTFRGRSGGGGAVHPPASSASSAHSSSSPLLQQKIETCHSAVLGIFNVPDYNNNQKKKGRKGGFDVSTKKSTLGALCVPALWSTNKSYTGKRAENSGREAFLSFFLASFSGVQTRTSPAL